MAMTETGISIDRKSERNFILAIIGANAPAD
jgi:hypothetical protein